MDLLNKSPFRLTWWGEWARDEHNHINTVITLIYFSLNNEHLLCLLWIFIEWITTKNISKSARLQGVQASLPALLLVRPPLPWEPQKSRTRELAMQVKQFTLCRYIFELLKLKPLWVRGIQKSLLYKLHCAFCLCARVAI